MDREKVIYSIERCISHVPDACRDCAYDAGHPYNECVEMMLKDTLALLKEEKEYCGKCAESAIKTTVELQEEIARLRSLLKEQDAVEPSFKQEIDGIFVWCCGSCGAYMYHIYDGIDKAKEYAKYCRQCGKKVKWE